MTRRFALVTLLLGGCTAIYGDYELNLNLGSQFQPGTTYTVKAGDKTATFTAQ